jgi:hypothetical protein
MQSDDGYLVFFLLLEEWMVRLTLCAGSHIIDVRTLGEILINKGGSAAVASNLLIMRHKHFGLIVSSYRHGNYYL